MQFANPVVDLLGAGVFAERVRDEFPQREERPAPPPMEERFGRPQPASPFTFEVLDRPPTARFRFLSQDASRLIQLQHDLFAFNWRKLNDDDAYPRYAYMRESTERYLTLLSDVVADAGREEIEPNWIEVSFINHIDAVDGHSRLGAVLTSVRDDTGERFLPSREEAELHERFLIEEGGEPVGRLRVSTSPAFRTSDESPIWIMNLTARIRSTGQGLGNAFERFDLAHEWVVRAFDELTTEDMHARWGKEAVAR